MYEELLIKSGLTTDQAKIYEVLLKKGVMPASKASLHAGLKRGLGYKVIEQLLEMGLVEKIDKKVALFAPLHPSKVQDLLQKKIENIKSTESMLSSGLGQMISDYNLNLGKPNVRFFEGKEGVKKVLEDSLYTQEEIYSYADINMIKKYIPDVNEWYVSEREKKQVKKKAVLLDSPEARATLADYHKGITDTRLIKSTNTNFKSVMQIYDGKVSYITLSDKQMIGVIIEDQAIYEMHRTVFEFNWSKAEEI